MVGLFLPWRVLAAAMALWVLPVSWCGAFLRVCGSLPVVSSLMLCLGAGFLASHRFCPVCVFAPPAFLSAFVVFLAISTLGIWPHWRAQNSSFGMLDSADISTHIGLGFSLACAGWWGLYGASCMLRAFRIPAGDIGA